jgi:hypothetical protein
MERLRDLGVSVGVSSESPEECPGYRVYAEGQVVKRDPLVSACPPLGGDAGNQPYHFNVQDEKISSDC